MLVIGRLAPVLVAAAVIGLSAGCSGGHDDPAPDSSAIDLNEMRGAMLQPQEVGPTWTTPDSSAAPDQMVSICGGTSKTPTAPPGAQIVSAPIEDAGDTGAQTLTQIALVYGNDSQAQAALTALKAVAQGCPASVSVPQTVTADKSEPAYTETVGTQPVIQNSWSGLAVVRHKSYEAKHPGTADTAVAILAKRNVVLVDAYAVYRLGAAPNASNDAQFTGDWQKLVGTVVNRVK
jgi:hypothetical protein